MNHEDAFLQTIVDTPDDDAPRLIFADWLEEHGDPERARFIRAQVRLAKLSEDSEERLRLQAEERELLPEMTKRLLDRKHPRGSGKLGPWVKDQRPSFERGFVARLATTPTKFLARADEVMKAAPIQHLALTNASYKFDELFASPYVPRLRSLTMIRQRLHDETIARLVGQPAVSGLRALDLSRNRFRIEGATALANSPHLGKLERLVLNGNRIHDRGPEALAASPHLAGLKRLELRDCQIGPRGAMGLAKAKQLATLEWLDLGQNRIGDQGLRALADASGLANLNHLDLAYGHFSSEGLRSLLQNVGLKRLTTLSLTVYEDTGADYWAVTPSDHLRGRLELRLNAWGVLPAEFHSSPLLAACAGLSLLDVGRLTDKGAASLAASPTVAGLRSLDLSGNALRDRAAQAIAESPHLKNLRHLSLAQNRITKVGVEALVRAPLLRQLTHLDLSTNPIGEDGAKALAKAEGLDGMLRLRLAGTSPGRWRAALSERFGWRVMWQ